MFKNQLKSIKLLILNLPLTLFLKFSQKLCRVPNITISSTQRQIIPSISPLSFFIKRHSSWIDGTEPKPPRKPFVVRYQFLTDCFNPYKLLSSLHPNGFPWSIFFSKPSGCCIKISSMSAFKYAVLMSICLSSEPLRIALLKSILIVERRVVGEKVSL